LFSRFGPLSRFHAIVLLAFAAILIAALATVTIGLRRHPSTHNLVGFIIAVLCDFYGLYVVVRFWPKLVVPKEQPALGANAVTFQRLPAGRTLYRSGSRPD
jgi:hypothetical protein